MNISVFGATGRVGRLLVDIISNDDSLRLASIYARNELDFSAPSSALITSSYKTFLDSSEIIIDFTLPDATQALIESALEGSYKPIVIGTTGLSSHQQNLLKEASKKMPILYATNMSAGVAVLKKLSSIASSALKGYDIEIVEMHHGKKKDAPSGTALTLANAVADARELNLDEKRVSGRNGNIGERDREEIGVMSLRGGDIVGKHTVGFYGDGEYIELTHVATNRETFARGAIRAALWLKDKPAGLYTIEDSLNLY
ncbi:MAG: 4-hydroxy-tetrahydrodipicolinate reductase [Campylobacterales bacterium]